MPRSLLTLPTEIRLAIYKCHFNSIVVRQGHGSKSSNHSSLLFTCRQIYHEAKPLFVPSVSFHFRSPTAMLDVLTTLSQQQIQEIRHIRVKAFPFSLYPVDDDEDLHYYITYHFSDVLPLFPGLQLDRLEVENCFHDEVGDGWGDGLGDGGEDIATYSDIKRLLKNDGWKELRFITPKTGFMSGDWDKSNLRVEQLVGWNDYLKHRDGEESSAYVKMFVANVPRLRGATDDPSTRTSYSAIPGYIDSNGPRPCAHRTGVDPETSDEVKDLIQREVLVVARRGKHASYVQDGSKLQPEIQKLFAKMSWQEVKNSRFYVDTESDPVAHL